MKRNTLYVVAAAILIAGAAVVIWQVRQRSAQSTEELRSAVVERGDMVVAVSAAGNIEPEERVELAFETSGQVVEVPVEVGDPVRTDDLLARLDTQRPALQADQAEADLAAARAQLERLKAGAQPEEVQAASANVRAAEANLDTAEAERDRTAAGAEEAQIAAAEAELAAALTQQKKADDWHDTTMECRNIKIPAGRVIELPNGEVITVTETIKETICPLLGVPEEQARYQLEAADEALEAARARLEETKAGANASQLRAAESNVAAAAANLDAIQAQRDLLLEGAAEEQITGAEALVTQTQASLEQAELAVERSTLRAPFDGIVAAVNIAAGEQASAGIPVVTLLDSSRFHVIIAVDELEIGRLEEGQTARLTLDALPDTVVSGTVRYVAEAAAVDTGIVTYDVRIDLAPTDSPIRADMTANAIIVVEELKDVLQIPTWVVRVDSDTGQTYVHRLVGDQPERVNIQLGARYEGIAQVLDGLSEGDVLVRLPESSPFDFSEFQSR
jgi:HlyD family secretion protein